MSRDNTDVLMTEPPVPHLGRPAGPPRLPDRKSKFRWAKGVNLAEEFPENPFCEAFRKVDEQVAAKQDYETYMIKRFCRTLEFLRSLNDPEITASAEVIWQRLIARQAELRQAVHTAVVPIRHTLSVTPQ